MPAFLLDRHGLCSFASASLATMLQCGVGELYGSAWRTRLHPDGNRVAVADLRQHAHERKAFRLHNHATGTSIVTRIRKVYAPGSNTLTGFYGWVQIVRLHRRELQATA